MLILLLVPAALMSGCINQPDGNNETNRTPDACAGVTCNGSAITCSDGFVSTCENICVNGICTVCTPDCSGHEKCQESWSCTSWSACENGTHDRICTDVNVCGTQENKPLERAVCAPDLPNHVLVTEVYYDTIGDDSLQEWIEVYNPTVDNVSLDGYYLLDNSKDSMKWKFPNGTIIPPAFHLVVAKNAQGFKELFGCTADFSGFKFQMNNDADRIGFYKDGTLIDMVAWGGDSGWTLSTPNDRSIKRNPINIDTDAEADWVTDQVAHPGRCFFSE